jgi:hypothetical protein
MNKGRRLTKKMRAPRLYLGALMVLNRSGIMGSWDEGSGNMPTFMKWTGYISQGTAVSVIIWVRYCCSCWITALQRSNEIRFY